MGHRLGLLWYWMICLVNKWRSFCCFWDCTQSKKLYYISNSFVDSGHYCISSEGFLPTVLAIMVIWIKMGCRFLLQWIRFCQNSSLWSVCLGWPCAAWLPLHWVTQAPSPWQRCDPWRDFYTIVVSKWKMKLRSHSIYNSIRRLKYLGINITKV